MTVKFIATFGGSLLLGGHNFWNFTLHLSPLSFFLDIFLNPGPGLKQPTLFFLKKRDQGKAQSESTGT